MTFDPWRCLRGNLELVVVLSDEDRPTTAVVGRDGWSGVPTCVLGWGLIAGRGQARGVRSTSPPHPGSGEVFGSFASAVGAGAG